MRAQILSAAAVGAVLGALVGCQTYDFQPLSPMTVAQTTTEVTIDPKHLKPNLWLLVDRSGSMVTNADACPPGSCTRWQALQDAMGAFLTNHGDVARMALTLLPANPEPGGSCEPAESDAVVLPPATAEDEGHEQELRDTAAQINAVIQSPATHCGNGTPTGASVAFVGSHDTLQQDDQRGDYILLLTDGLPNCNEQNADNCTSGRCYCTVSACRQDNSYCARGCLDDNATAAVIGQQKSKGIQTVVLAFGREATARDGAAPAALAKMANAGGTRFRKCTTNNDCDPTGTLNDTCNAGFCSRQYFSANNAEELANALLAISQSAVGQDACTIQLSDPPPSAQYVAVLNNGSDVPAAGANGVANWTFDGTNIVFPSTSPYCQAIMTKDTAYKIQVRYVKCLTSDGKCV